MSNEIKGECYECGRLMVTQRVWQQDQRRLRTGGRAKYGGYGRCQACYRRAHRHDQLPTVTIQAHYPVVCSQCGPVGEAESRLVARQVRTDHLKEQHGYATDRPTPLSDTEVARLRRLVGLSP